MLDKVGEKHLTVVSDADTAVLQPAGAEELARSDLENPVRNVWYYVGRSLLAIVQAALMVAVLAGAYVIADRMIAGKPEPRKRQPFKTVYTVETVDAVLKDHQPSFTSYGQTVAARNVDLRALVSGEIVSISPKLRVGERINQGEPLVEINNFEYRGALSEAKANLKEAQARLAETQAQIALEKGRLEGTREQLEFAQADVVRAETLLKRRSTTQQQLEARKLIVSQRKQALAQNQDTVKVQEAREGQMQASMDRLQWRVEQAQRNLNSTTLVAPFSGVVRVASAEIGRVVTANDVVVSLYEADTLEVRFTLNDSQYGRLQTDRDGLIGRKVDVVWVVGGREWIYPATIERLGAEITSNRGGVEVFARVGETDNAVAIRPGAFVEVRVPDVVFANSVSVPDTAIYGTDTVYVEVDGKLVEKTVKIAAFEGERVIVASGLESGEKVLITRISEVSEGLAVRREGDPVAPPKAKGKSNGKTAASGPPSEVEMTAIAKANKITLVQFRALPTEERRKLVRSYRSANR